MESAVYIQSANDAARRYAERFNEEFGDIAEALLKMASTYLSMAEREGAARYEVHKGVLDRVTEIHPSRTPVDAMDFSELLDASEVGPDYITAGPLLASFLTAVFVAMRGRD
jgi:hypothetical protein